MEARGFECVDYGAYSLDEKVDYPIPGRTVAEAIRRGDIDKGVLVCGTGVGISLAANKVPGIRAGVCSEPFTAKMICDAFFDAEFQGGRHQRRVDLISKIEEDYGYSDAEIK